MADRECLVCRKSSNGMHFGALTCRACAAFFRRATVLKLSYVCSKGTQSCSVEGLGRDVCKYCRLLKCYNIGMDESKIQIGYDPSYSARCSPNEKDEVILPDIDIAEGSSSSNNIQENGRETICIDFGTLEEQIEEMFSFTDKKGEKTGNDFHRMCIFLQEVFEKSRIDDKELQIIQKLDISTIVEQLKSEVLLIAKFLSRSARFTNINKSEKMKLFKKSWSIIRNFKRLQTSSLILKGDLYSSKIVIFEDKKCWKIEETELDYSPITNVSNNYIKELFQPFVVKYIEIVGKPIYEMNLSIEEVTFCMIQLIGLNDYDIDDEILSICNELKEEAANELHKYYQSKSVEMYSSRIIKMMSILNNMKKIHVEKSKIKELFWIFDIFRAKITEPKFFEVF